MSVHPISFNPADGTATAVCDETGHVGILAPTAVSFGTNLDGTPNLRVLNIACPDNCGKASSHPIAQGAAPAAIQELFARTIARAGCPCGVVKAGAALLVAVSHARLEAERAGGLGTWVAGTIR